MPSPLPPQLQLSSSHTSATPTLSYKAQQHRKASTDKPGLVQRTSSSTSLHRSASNKSNSSSGTSKAGKVHHAHGHHAHVAHTSAGTKHHRATSFGHRVPSYGKGLNKLTALTTVVHDEPHPQQPGKKQFLTIDSLVARAAAAGGTSMQRSLSEGSTLAKKDRRQSGSSVNSSRPRVRRPKSQHGMTDKHPKQHVTFSTQHSSDEDDDDEIVHRKSNEIVASPISRSVDHHQGLPQNHHRISPAPPSMIHRPGPQKSALKEHLSSSAPKFLQKNLSQVALVPPKVSITNAVSKDLTKQSTSVEHSYPEIASQSTPSSEPQMPPSSNPVSHFITSTPPSRSQRTPDLDMTSIRRNQSSASLPFHQDHTLPLTSTSQGKLTRTQQKLLLQRASTQPPQPLNLGLPTSYSSPSLAQVAHMETAPDYFSPLPPTPTTSNSIGATVNMTYDVKVAREFERISRELVNARRFGDPTGHALARLRNRINPTTSQSGLAKKQSAFGLSMSWKRSPDKHEGRARIDGVGGDGIFGGEKRSKVREVMRRLWFDEVDVADVMAGSFEDDRDDEVQLAVRSGTGFKRISSADSH